MNDPEKIMALLAIGFIGVVIAMVTTALGRMHWLPF